MRILHLSHTPLVGAPGRICNALNLLDGVEARWAVLNASVGLYDKMSFELDWLWTRDKAAILGFAEKSDVLHLHNFIDLDCKDFAPIDFRALWERGQPMLRHFHSTPELIARYMGCTEQAASDCPIPKLVLAQFHERYFPNARLVPNLPGVLRQPPRQHNGPVRIGYAPSRFNSGRSSRWDTKGYPETVRMLREFRRAAERQGIAIEIDVIELVSHAECLKRKADCDLFIDDLVTGSYHLNTLESLAMGRVCVTYLDSRTKQALFELLGRDDFPIVNVGLENAMGLLLELAKDRALIDRLSRHSAEWMATHWNPQHLAASHFLDAYRIVSAQPRKHFPARFNPDDPLDHWQTVRLQDALWRERQSQWPALPSPLFIKLKSMLGSLLRYFKLK